MLVLFNGIFANFYAKYLVPQLNLKFQLVFVIPFCLKVICCKTDYSTLRNYCFKGDVYSPIGHVFEHSSLIFPTDSTFILTNFFFDSRKERRIDKFYSKEEFKGSFVFSGDSIKCIVEEPNEYSGMKYFFYKDQKKMWMLGLDKRILQRWYVCNSIWYKVL